MVPKTTSHALPAIALVVTAILSTPASLHAQQREDPRRPGQFRFGPLYLTPSVALKNIGVDTNVFNQAEDPKSDFTVTGGPTVGALMRIGRFELSANGVADLVYFRTYSSERSVNTNLDVRGEIRLHRLTLFAENGFFKTRQRPNFEIDARSRRLQNQVRVGGSVRLLSKLDLELAGRNAIVEYDRDVIFLGASLHDELNRDERAVSASLRYAVTPLTTFVVTGEAEQARFPFSPVRNTDSFRVMPGVELNPRGAYLRLRPRRLPPLSGARR